MRIREESRTSTAVIDPTSGEQTEINEQGPEVSAGELDLFREKLLYLAKGAAVCVFAGSLPRGAPATFYAELIAEVKKLGVVTVIDSAGEPMSLAMRAGPTIVTPNEREAEELVGHEFADDDDRLIALGEIVELGAERGDHDPGVRLPCASRRSGRRRRRTAAAPPPPRARRDAGRGRRVR